MDLSETVRHFSFNLSIANEDVIAAQKYKSFAFTRRASFTSPLFSFPKTFSAPLETSLSSSNIFLSTILPILYLFLSVLCVSSIMMEPRPVSRHGQIYDKNSLPALHSEFHADQNDSSEISASCFVASSLRVHRPAFTSW